MSTPYKFTCFHCKEAINTIRDRHLILRNSSIVTGDNYFPFFHRKCVSVFFGDGFADQIYKRLQEIGWKEANAYGTTYKTIYQNGNEFTVSHRGKA